MSLSSFGYFTVYSDKLADWEAYGTKFLGLQLAEKTASQLKFRMDDRKQRIVVSSEPEAATAFGWEVDDAVALDDLAARLEAAETNVSPMPADMLARRAVTGGIAFADPAGNLLEVFYGPEVSSEPFKAGREISGFRTGVMGMGHAVLLVERLDDVQWFYQDVLGFRISDFVLEPFKAFFFHLNPRHHSLALIEGTLPGIHHIMMELNNLDDVGQGYDIAMATEDRVSASLGRHTNDFMTSFYARTPESFFVEYGWGGRIIDPEAWEPHELKHGPSLWGHDRPWAPAHELAERRRFRALAAEEGLRIPVQVTEDNASFGVNNCAWWETTKTS
ncbi:MAG: VOC family protein [Pseudomonadota bacterium]